MPFGVGCWDIAIDAKKEIWSGKTARSTRDRCSRQTEGFKRWSTTKLVMKPVEEEVDLEERRVKWRSVDNLPASLARVPYAFQGSVCWS